ncbi:hypothetical protein Pcinc_019340 [Petrolisthes cinctipes]|uniref:USP domain-containing protein n=1 Tax=Petrolisthes cinctipes TaxID=88211 RepID=A0AAE1FLJ4_PETCI|nr:hypothetical protein Pcinc_019340 [Petrolisthes cinctipes]
MDRDADGPCEEADGGGAGEEGAAGKARVVYPSEGLTLDTLVTQEDGCSPVYDLVSVCIHQGTTSSGHYTAYSRSGSGGWWLWDDTNLQASQLNQVVSQPDAHLLFYQATHDSYV